jgi:type I restriction enzyme S subunit
MLPEGWEKVKFTDVLDIQGGTQPPKSTFIDEKKDGYIRLLQIRDFGKKPVPTYVPDTKKLKKCTKNNILIGRYGASVGRICTDMEGAYNVALAKVLKDDNIVDDKYLKYYLTSSLFQIPLSMISRSAQNGFNKQDLAEIDFLLPSLVEQKQIAQKLDQVLARVERIKTALDNAPATIKRFRQSVLALGTSGGLIEKNEKWEDVTIDDILDNIRYGTSKKCSYDDTLTPVLRIPNIKDSKINTEDIKSANFNEKEFETLALKVGDILVIRSNGSIDLVGKNVVVTKEHENYIFAGYLIRVRLNMTFANPKYIHYVLSSPQTREVINLTAKSTSGVNNLNSKEIGAFKVSLPPLQEQKAIVKKIETLFAIADNLEAKVTQAQQRVEQLTQSILAKAFRGELK